MTAKGNVDHAIATETQTVGSVLPAGAFELDDCLHLLERPVAVVVRETIQGMPIGTFARYEHIPVEREDSLTRFDLRTVLADIFGDAVLVFVEDQQ